jgi:hypothetical protein
MMSALDRRILSLSVILGPLVTVVVTPWFNFDPINLVKVMILSVVSFGILGLILGSPRILSRFSSGVWSLLLFFPISLFVPFFFADSPKSQQFWGVFGRNTGVLTYLSLSILTIAISLMRSEQAAEKILKSLLGTSIAITLYCIIQALNLDPINWSQKDIFATLGNVNFLSAFLGMSSVLIFTLLLDKDKSLNALLLFSLLITNLALIFQTDSIQGIVIFFVGVTLVVYAKIRVSIKLKRILPFAASFYIVSVVLAGFGLAKKGPLASLLYQDSTVFRGDYITAALRMFQKFPITGVGMDSYDNWYRRVRGFITAYRTGPTRTTNSAHNVVLDLTAGGGIFVLLGYLMLVIFALICGLRIFKASSNPSKWDVALFATWSAYQVQSLVSINQISVGIWGWIFSGVLISRYFTKREISLNDEKKTSRSYRQKNTQQLVRPQSAILGLVLAFVGFAAASPPVNADIQFREITGRGDLPGLLKLSLNPGATAFHLAKSLEITYKNEKLPEAQTISENLAKRFPFEPFVWQIRAGMSSLDTSARDEALQKLEEYDPWFACFRPDPVSVIKNWYFQLPREQRWELLTWWEIAKGPLRSNSQLGVLERSDRFTGHIRAYCNL